MSEGKSDQAPLRPDQFETALRELEGLVERMERGDQTLEESLRDFERGIALSNQCGEALKAAEQRVAMVTGDNPEAAPQPWNTQAAAEAEAAPRPAEPAQRPASPLDTPNDEIPF